MIASTSMLFAWDYEHVQIGELFYNLDTTNKTAEVISGGYGGYSGSIVIPKNVDYHNITYTVIGIGNNAFSSCDSLISLTIPDGVTYIGDNAFFSCDNLTDIHFPSSITYVGTGVFYYGDPWYSNRNNGCWRQEKLYIGKCLYTSYQTCNDWTIEDSTVYICANAFDNCNMSNIYIPNSVERIGNEAFYNCRKLQSIHIGSGLKQIGFRAFGYCPIQHLYIQDIAKWCDVQFSQDWSHPFSYFPSYEIDRHLYFNGTEVTDLVIPEGVTKINGSFRNCSNIKTVVLPQTLISIGEDAFSDCTELSQIELPESLRSIGEDAFTKTAITEITLPDSIETIGSYAFSYCEKLVSAVIPSNIKSIGYKVFNYCTNLPYVILLASQLPQITVPHEYSSTKLPLYVPSMSFDNYRKNSNWKKMYQNIKPLAVLPIKENNGPTSVAINFGYGDEGRYVESCGIVDGQVILGDKLEYNGLEPYSEYKTVNFFVNTTTGYSDTVNINFTTTALELTTKPSRPVSSTTAILLAETNMSDAEVSCGFEYKRNDAPDDMAGTKVFCPVASGQMAGRLKNLKDDVYYKYRAFYQSAAGNMYYGDWQYIFTGDVAVEFDPILYTYGATVVRENEATISGYALAGSEDFTEQGFEYWAESRANNGANAPHRMPAALNEHFFVQASGIALRATLNNLDAGTVYRYRVYGKVGDQYYYGSEQTFTTTGTYTPPTYTITFANWDGATLQSLQVEEGTLPEYTGVTPIRPDDEQYTYVFDGWTPAIVVATADATYTATYQSEPKSQGIEDIQGDDVQCTKVLRDGTIYILRGDKTYTLTGQEVK